MSIIFDRLQFSVDSLKPCRCNCLSRSICGIGETSNCPECGPVSAGECKTCWAFQYATITSSRDDDDGGKEACRLMFALTTKHKYITTEGKIIQIRLPFYFIHLMGPQVPMCFLLTRLILASFLILAHSVSKSNSGLPSLALSPKTTRMIPMILLNVIGPSRPQGLTSDLDAQLLSSPCL